VLVTHEQTRRLIELPRQGYSLAQAIELISHKIKNLDFDKFSLKWTKPNGTQLIIREEQEFTACVEEGDKLEFQLQPIYGNQNTTPKKTQTTNTTNTNTPPKTTTPQKTTTTNNIQNTNTNMNNSKTYSTITTNTNTPPKTKQPEGNVISTFTLEAVQHGAEKVEVKAEQQGGRQFIFRCIQSRYDTEVTVALENSTLLNFILKYTAGNSIMTLTKSFNLPLAVTPSMFSIDQNVIVLTFN